MREECIYDDNGNIFQDYLEESSWGGDSAGSDSDEVPSQKEPTTLDQTVAEKSDAAIVIQSINQVPLNIFKIAISASACRQLYRFFKCTRARVLLNQKP